MNAFLVTELPRLQPRFQSVHCVAVLVVEESQVVHRVNEASVCCLAVPMLSALNIASLCIEQSNVVAGINVSGLGCLEVNLERKLLFRGERHRFNVRVYLRVASMNESDVFPGLFGNEVPLHIKLG